MEENLKKANSLDEFDGHRVLELKRCKNDIIYFCKNYVKVQHPARGAVMFEPYDYQLRMLEGFSNNRFNLVVAGRQLGKSTVIAIYILHAALFDFNKSFLIASNKDDNAKDIMSRIKYAYEYLPSWLKPGVKVYNTKKIVFDNKCAIVSQATSPNTGRGGSYNKVLLDELAFVPKRIQEEMWASIAPTISTGGSLLVSSTPNGDSDLFASLYRKSKVSEDGFNLIEVKWDEHPDRDEKYKKMMIGKIGQQKWYQEYECIDGDQIVTVYDSVLKKDMDISLKDFHELLNS